VSGYSLDTSGLAKLYHQEDGSLYVERLVAVRGSNTIISRLSLVEMESVLAIKVRTGELDAGGRELARRRLRADVAQARIRVGPTIDEGHYRKARNLLARYGVEGGLGTLDAIQLAVALGPRDLELVSVFVAADQRLCRAAEDRGFSIVDPTNPGVLIV
jgi:predicted nucleic acid-binding protein